MAWSKMLSPQGTMLLIVNPFAADARGRIGCYS
jgi:hypothetical protein